MSTRPIACARTGKGGYAHLPPVPEALAAQEASPTTNRAIVPFRERRRASCRERSVSLKLVAKEQRCGSLAVTKAGQTNQTKPAAGFQARVVTATSVYAKVHKVAVVPPPKRRCHETLHPIAMHSPVAAVTSTRLEFSLTCRVSRNFNQSRDFKSGDGANNLPSCRFVCPGTHGSRATARRQCLQTARTAPPCRVATASASTPTRRLR